MRWPCTPGPVVTAVLAYFHITSYVTRLDLDPAGSPTGGGKTCSGGTSGAKRRIRAGGSGSRRSQGNPSTASSNSVSHASISSTISIGRAGCTPSVVPIAQSLAPTPPPRIPRKMPSCHQLVLSADAAHMLLSTHPPNLLCHWSAKLAPHAQLIQRLPVEPWPEPIDRGHCMRYQPCQAVMNLRRTPFSTPGRPTWASARGRTLDTSSYHLTHALARLQLWAAQGVFATLLQVSDGTAVPSL